MTRRPKRASYNLPLLARMMRHIVESEIDRGRSPEVAARIAAATVNKRRAQLARGKLVCKTRRGRVTCTVKRGPKLVGQGGSRRQWYPGKKTRRERYVCLGHRRRFKAKAGLIAHYRGWAHGKRRAR